MTPDGSVIVHVNYRLSLPAEVVAEMMKDHPPPSDPEDDSWEIALEERVKDRLPDILSEHGTFEPDVEVL